MIKIMFCLAILLLALSWGCAPDVQNHYDYKCGTQLNSAKLAEFEAKAIPKYTFEDLKLLGKISSLVFNENGRTKNYDVQFWRNSQGSLVVQIFGLSDESAIDRSACAVFGFKDYIFPKETILLFYRTEKEATEQEIVAGLKKK